MPPAGFTLNFTSPSAFLPSFSPQTATFQVWVAGMKSKGTHTHTHTYRWCNARRQESLCCSTRIAATTPLGLSSAASCPRADGRTHPRLKFHMVHRRWEAKVEKKGGNCQCEHRKWGEICHNGLLPLCLSCWRYKEGGVEMRRGMFKQEAGSAGGC